MTRPIVTNCKWGGISLRMKNAFGDIKCLMKEETSFVGRLGPVQVDPVNPARSGRKQRYMGSLLCRRITWPLLKRGFYFHRSVIKEGLRWCDEFSGLGKKVAPSGI